MDIPWFDTFRQYLKNINGRIEITNAWRPKPQRAKDTFLMENFLNLKTYTPREMKILNACRMYYQVARVSAITTPDGSRLRANISSNEMSREQLNKVYQPQHKWPKQERPDKKAWNLWEKALHLTVCNNSGKLYTPLGRWKQELDNTWKYFSSQQPIISYMLRRTKDGPDTPQSDSG
eukprot:scaffold141687_cov34-Attheya_sp.AAC.3